MAVASGPAVTFSVSARPSTTTTARGMMLRPCASASASASAAGVSGGARFRAEATGNGRWWAPLLGWSGQPDYIDGAPPAPPREEEDERAAKGQGQRRFGVLTEEKARQLRARMVETESFHDAMYHSAIASRLARST